MADSNATLERLRRICLALPDTKETPTWGQPHFRVQDKIFAGFGEEAGHLTIGFKLDKAHAHALIDDRRFFRAPYVGQHGWVSMRAEGKIDWDAVREYIHESYGLIAPKASKAKLAPKPAATVKPKAKPAAKPATSRSTPSGTRSGRARR